MKQVWSVVTILTLLLGLTAAQGQTTNVMSSTNAVWKYFDTGVDPGPSWTSANFNDAAWPSGTAPLGYGMTSITTTQASGRVTYYHRRQFTDNLGPSGYSNLIVRLRRDDGAVVYLNGTELFRANMPTGAVDRLTLASSSISGGAQFTYFASNVSPALLVAGVNQLAVEVHQASSNNVDGALDLELLGIQPACVSPVITNPPQNQIVCIGGSATFSVGASGTAPLTYEWRYIGDPAGMIRGTNSSLSISNAQPTDAGSYLVIVGNACGQSAASATLTVSNCPPVISSLSLSNIQMGDILTITGTGFDPNPRNNCVVVGNGARNIPLRVIEASSSQLRVLVPPIPPGAQPGPIMVVVGQGAEAGFIDTLNCPTCSTRIRVPNLGSSGQDGVAGFFDVFALLPEDLSVANIGSSGQDGVAVALPISSGWSPLAPVWTFSTLNPAGVSPAQVTPIPTPLPPPRTNWVFSTPATNGGVSIVISNDCPPLTRVQLQGDFALAGTNFGMDIIFPNLIIQSRLPAVPCAQAICDMLVAAYEQAGIRITCTVTPLGGNAARITISVPGGTIVSGGLTICFSPAESGLPTPIITDITPLTAAEGDLVTIIGGGFGNNPDNVCLQVAGPGRTIPLRVLEATDDRIVARLGSVPPDAVPGPLGLMLGIGRAQSITDTSNRILSPQPAWVFASTQPGIMSPQIFTPIPVPTPTPVPGQPTKKKFFSQAVGQDGTVMLQLDPDCATGTKITIEAHFELMDADPGDGIDCPMTGIDTLLNGSLTQSQDFGGGSTGGNCVDFVCQFLTQIFYDKYNAQFGPCFGYPLTCTADLATGKITINAECGCKIVSGVIIVEYCIPPVVAPGPPIISAVIPSTFTSGNIIKVRGTNFPTDPDNLCMVVMNPGRFIPLRVVAATPSELDVEVGPVPQGAVAGPIGLATGDGNTGRFRPAFFDIFVADDAWFFATTNGGITGPVVTPVPTPPPTNQVWYHSFLSNGQIYVFLPGPCPPGTKLTMDGHFDIQSSNSPIRHADCWLPAVSYLQGGSAVNCAWRICDSFVCGFFQRTGVRLNCNVIPSGNGALVCIGYPGGAIVNGCMTVCVRVCDQPPILPCLTNIVVRIANGTTNDNFVGPEGTFQRPDYLTYLNGAGITLLRPFDDGTLVNRVFAHSFTNLPECITKATLRIRLRANNDFEENDTIGLMFAGPGGTLDPNRWGAYIGAGNAGYGLLPSVWNNGNVTELVLDLGRLPTGPNSFKDLIPTLCAKRYLDILVQDDTSVDYAILTVESCRCRADIVVCSDFGTNRARVAYSPPAYTDLCCPNMTNTLRVVCVPPPNTLFPIGTNAVKCSITDAMGRRSTCCFRVIVQPTSKPGIITQPVDVITSVGGTATFTVAAGGTAPLGYQWYFNNMPIAGAIATSFTRNPVAASHEGNYQVVISNGCGMVTSVIARLRINRCCTNNMVAGFNLIACPYQIGGNTLNEVLPGAPVGSQFYKFDNASQTWQVAVKTAGGWVPNLMLKPGEGAFLKSPSAFTLVMCGPRITPVLPIPILAGRCYLLSRQSDDFATYDNIVGTPPMDGSTLYRWNPATQSYEAFVYFDGIGWDPMDPFIAPCTAVWICPPGGGNVPTPPLLPTITGVSPGTLQPGCVLTISGTGFGQNPDNVCAVIMSGTQTFPLQVLDAMDTLLRVRLNGLPPGTPVTGRIAVATGQGTMLPSLTLPSPLGTALPSDLLGLVDMRVDDGGISYVGPCDADPVAVGIGPTAVSGRLLQAAWVFQTANPPIVSTQTIVFNPPPPPGPGTNWIFSTGASNCSVSFVISNDCPALTRVFIQGDLSVTTSNGLGLDIIIPNLIINTRLPASACARMICDLLKAAYAAAGVTIDCSVVNLGTNAARLTITVPGGCISGAGVMLCFAPGEAGRPDPIITGFDPVSGQAGDIITITGSGFGNDPLCLCAQVLNGPSTVWMRVLTAQDDRITAELGTVGPNAFAGPIGLVRGYGRAQSIGDRSNIVVNPIPAWAFASTQPGVMSAAIFTPQTTPPPPPPPAGQPMKKKFLSQSVSNGVMCIFVDPDCPPDTKISIHAHFDLMDADPLDGIDCPLLHIDTAMDGSWWHSQLYTGLPTGGNCADFVCQYLTQIFFDQYNAQFGACFGYPISCSADLATGKLTLTAECGCKLVSGVVEVEYCIPPQGGTPPPVITAVIPSTFTSGQIISVRGTNFPTDPNDVCIVVVNQTKLLPLRVVAATAGELTVEVGPIPPDAQPGPIGMAVGDGSMGVFRPAFFDIFADPGWFFSSTNTGIMGPVVTPVYTPPPPQEVWYHSFLSNGQVYVYLPGPCPPGSKLIMDGHFNIQIPGKPIQHVDAWLPAVNFLQGGSALHCAWRICDSFVCGFQQRTGVRLSCQVIPAGTNGALVCIGYPGGTIVAGGMTVCVRVCNQPPIAQCYTNTTYVLSHGTTNDNFVGAEAASPRPELLTYLTNAGIANFRGYDDANQVNRFFADSFANLPECITRATLRIRIRANNDIEENDTIGLQFHGAGGALDPDRWSSYIGAGNPGNGLLNAVWSSPSVVELTLDLSRLPLGGNMFKDLIPTLCAKRYLDIVLQDDTSVDYAILTLETCRCRPDLVVCAANGATNAYVTYVKPTFTDLCCPNMPAALNVVCVPPSGSFFPLGTTSVKCTATDTQGRRSRCCFSVVVQPGTPPSVCANPTMTILQFGNTNDNFVGPQGGSPSPGLIKRLSAAGIRCFKGFDDCTVDCFFAHTFTNLPSCITEATLRIRLKACAQICANDSLGLSFSQPNGSLPPLTGWGRYIGAGNAAPGLFGGVWNANTVQEFVLDLAALPNPSGPPTDLIPQLNIHGLLDVVVQDDSAVDYIVLTLKSCCCRPDIVMSTAPNACCAVPNYSLPVFTSPCATNVSVVCVPPPTNCFPVGTNLVVCTGTDSLGYSGKCSFKIIVRDAVAPIITLCPSNVVACAGTNLNIGVMPDLTLQVIASDNCTPAGQLIILQNPPPGATIVNTAPAPTVTFTVIDGAGNSNTCTRPIVVQPCCVPPPSGLVLWLPFDEITGPAAYNAAGGNLGILSNAPTRDSSGYVSRSLCFDGIDDYVTVPSYTAINFGTNDFSIDAWVKPVPGENQIRIIVDHRAETTNVVGYSLFLGNGNNLGFQIADGTHVNYPSTFNVPADGQWHFVAVTVNRGATNGIRFYLDGVIDPVPRDPTGHPGSVSPPFSTHLRVSSRSSSLSGFFRGCIDEVELFRRALTTAEVQTLYSARNMGKCRIRCTAPWDVPICLGQTSVTVTASICNPTPFPQTVNYTFQGLPIGPGCRWPGPTVFIPAGGVVTIPAGGCVTVPVTMLPPAGLPCGYSACWQIIVSPTNNPGQRFACAGSIVNSCKVCATPPVVRTNLLDCVRTPVGSFVIVNTTSNAINLTGTRLRAIGPDMEPDTRIISLNGLPPGVPWEVPPGLILPPQGGGGGFDPAAGDMVELPLDLQFMDFDPNQPYTIVLEADLDGDGEFEPLTSMEAQTILPEEAYLTIVRNANGTVTLEWPPGWILQQTSSLPATPASWSDVAGATSPFTTTATAMKFFRARK